MSFHDVRLPEYFSEGSLFGLGFGTKFISMEDSMVVYRIARGPAAGRRIFNLERGLDSVGRLVELYHFFMARGGGEHSFRVKDWIDCDTTLTGSAWVPGAPQVSDTDQDLVSLGGNLWQFVKRYTSGPTTILRTIRGVIANTVVLSDDSGAISSGFSVDAAAGTVLFTDTPDGQVRGGCEFDTICHFDEGTDKAFQVALRTIGSGDLPEIRCVEDVDPEMLAQDYHFGGHRNFGDMGGADVLVSLSDGLFQIFAPTAVGLDVRLPDSAQLPLGGPFFVMHNDGAQNLTIKTYDDTSLTTGFAPGDTISVFLGTDADDLKVWYLLE